MFKNYLKTALAVLRRNKFFTFISLFGISCTLTVLMVICAFCENLFSSTYPEINSGRSLYLLNIHYEDSVTHNNINTSPSFKFLKNYVKSLKTPEKVSIHSFPITSASYLKNKKNEFKMMFTDESFWQILHFSFLEGKPFTNEQILNAPKVAILSENTKKIYFGNENAVGKNFESGGTTFSVIGVVKNVPKTQFFTTADFYVPYTAPKSGYQNDGISGNYNAILLAKGRSDFETINNEIQQIIPNIPMPNKNFSTLSMHADRYFESFTRMALGDNNSSGIGKAYFISTILLFLFFLLPTVNLVNINISRIMDRSSEIGVRKAFGGSSRILVFQFLFENLVITFIGGIFAILLTQIILTIINNSGIISDINLNIDFNVLFYGVILCSIFGVFSGVYPAFKMSKLDIIKSLKGAS